MSDPYTDFVVARLDAGDSRDEIVKRISLEVRDTVCSICGVWLSSMCEHGNDPNQRVISRREFEAAKEQR